MLLASKVNLFSYVHVLHKVEQHPEVSPVHVDIVVCCLAQKLLHKTISLCTTHFKFHYRFLVSLMHSHRSVDFLFFLSLFNFQVAENGKFIFFCPTTLLLCIGFDAYCSHSCRHTQQCSPAAAACMWLMKF